MVVRYIIIISYWETWPQKAQSCNFLCYLFWVLGTSILTFTSVFIRWTKVINYLLKALCNKCTTDGFTANCPVSGIGHGPFTRRRWAAHNYCTRPLWRIEHCIYIERNSVGVHNKPKGASTRLSEQALWSDVARHLYYLFIVYHKRLLILLNFTAGEARPCSRPFTSSLLK